MKRPAIDILAPKGRLRVAVNLGNSVLVQKDPDTGMLGGISVKLSQLLAQELGLALKYIEYESAGRVIEAVSRDEWDLAFLAVDPLRAKTLFFSEPYLIIEGGCLVFRESPLKSCEEIDKKGIRIAVGRNAAYDLHLSRTLQHADLVRAPTTPGAVELFMKEHLDVAAGIKGPLEQLAMQNNTVRVLDGSFMQIRQAMVIPHRAAASRHLVDDFVKRLQATDMVKNELVKSGQDPSIAI